LRAAAAAASEKNEVLPKDDDEAATPPRDVFAPAAAVIICGSIFFSLSLSLSLSKILLLRAYPSFRFFVTGKMTERDSSSIAWGTRELEKLLVRVS
jgi:hypothetical protein